MQYVSYFREKSMNELKVLFEKMPESLLNPGLFVTAQGLGAGQICPPPPSKNSPDNLYDTYLIHHPEIHIFRDTMQRSSPIVKKNLDLRVLQTFSIIWSNIISTRHNKGKSEILNDSTAAKI